MASPLAAACAVKHREIADWIRDREGTHRGWCLSSSSDAHLPTWDKISRLHFAKGWFNEEKPQKRRVRAGAAAGRAAPFPHSYRHVRYVQVYGYHVFLRTSAGRYVPMYVCTMSLLSQFACSEGGTYHLDRANYRVLLPIRCHGLSPRGFRRFPLVMSLV
ncbi:hypothetical protein LX32DRAFT_444093 [Colletotrichum zoysiae]|uniref:Uncharacterized protein n=1 Tax=Colletotrichum zoysiae TaxID=1216348 RepID=A0AAD9M6Y7_9PEZI|nr:hypothetical protein LX32DRAFT_444093 [Colletotrichum zoysiae]